MDWTQILGAGGLNDQQGQIDQQLADLLTRRRAYRPAEHTTGLGALLGGIGDYRNRQAFNDQETALRQQRSDLAKQAGGLRSTYADALMGARQPTPEEGMQGMAAGMNPFASDPSATPKQMQAGGAQAAQLGAAQGERQQASGLDRLRQTAVGGMLSGDPVMAHAGQVQLGAAQQEAETARHEKEFGLKHALDVRKLDQENWDVRPNPAGGFVMFNKKTGATKPVGGGGGQAPGGSDAKRIADAIVSGQQPPDLKGLYRMGPAVRAELAKQGYDFAAAQQEWSATQKHLSSLNGTQQERLRQAVDFTAHSLDTIEGLFNDWKAVGATSGLKLFNKASLAVAKQLPGDAGAAAQALEAQINDLTAELANVYMGGNSPTDHALKLAASNLSANWNEETLKKAIGLAKTNLNLRRNAMNTSQTAGGSRYDRKPEANSGATATPDAAALRKKYGL